MHLIGTFVLHCLRHRILFYARYVLGKINQIINSQSHLHFLKLFVALDMGKIVFLLTGLVFFKKRDSYVIQDNSCKGDFVNIITLKKVFKPIGKEPDWWLRFSFYLFRYPDGWPQPYFCPFLCLSLLLSKRQVMRKYFFLSYFEVCWRSHFRRRRDCFQNIAYIENSVNH